MILDIKIFVFIVYVCFIASSIDSFRIHSQESNDDMSIKPYSIDDAVPLANGHGSARRTFSQQLHPYINDRRSDSAEKYFHWASKSNRPMEYLRGRRFWLFTRKDEQDMNQEAVPQTGLSPSSLSQGIWRSGIVGRRRR